MSEIKSLDDVKKIADSGQFAKHDLTGVPVDKAKSVMNLEVEVDSDLKPQELTQTIRPFYDMAQSIPSHLAPQAQIVLQAIFACFERQKDVKEGKLKDMVWGFEQCGFAPRLTLDGIVLLIKAGYLKLQAPDNTDIDLTSSKVDEAWVRYEKKLLDLVYSA